MKTLKVLFDNNAEWAERIKKEDPDFFLKLSKQQSPEYLWIGCSDSRVPANQIVNLAPGEVFVHRNVGNIVVHSDLNCLSVIQYAVEVLKVKHIIVCGHYGCGGVKASMNEENYGFLDNWLGHIKDVCRFNMHKLAQVDACDKFDTLCELNVIEQVKNVCNTTIVQKAWKNGNDISVHGWIYDIKSGLLKDLESCVTLADYK